MSALHVNMSGLANSIEESMLSMGRHISSLVDDRIDMESSESCTTHRYADPKVVTSSSPTCEATTTFEVASTTQLAPVERAVERAVERVSPTGKEVNKDHLWQSGSSTSDVYDPSNDSV